jgi:ABC-2 type transport system permease protein
MKKLLSLLKVSLNHDMNLFTIKSKKNSRASKVLVPLLLTFYIMALFSFYSFEIINVLKPLHMEYFLLTIFAFSTSLLTIVEGIYKSSSLLFNCKDDQLVLSLPIKRRTILFIRIFKFYLFELLYNSLFLLPSIIVYALTMKPTFNYYIVSFIALIILPIVPIVISCIIGSIVTYLSSKFKGKNLFQTIISFILLLGIFYVSFKSQGIMTNIAEKSESINSVMSKYYPVGTYISLVLKFDIVKLLIFILVHLLIFTVTIFILGNVYFKINSSFKRVLVHHKKGKYVIKTRSIFRSFVKKELSRFLYTPVFIVNAGFGLVLHIALCIVLTVKYKGVISTLSSMFSSYSQSKILSIVSLIVLVIILFSSMMTSITSSMISLESKSFNILKSLPIKASKIVLYKVITALLIVIPCILLGDIIIFIGYRFDILTMILLLVASIAIPFVSELIGILMNLKYPKMDATNDSEIVKQSFSATASVFIGMGIIGAALTIIVAMFILQINSIICILLIDIIFIVITLILWSVLKKTSDKKFNEIES